MRKHLWVIGTVLYRSRRPSVFLKKESALVSPLMTEMIGYAAAALGTFVMLPQVWKTIRSKSAHDVSGIMLGIYLVQNILWFAYGMLIESIPLIACNVVAFGLCSFQAFLKMRYN